MMNRLFLGVVALSPNAKNERQANRRQSLGEDGALKLAQHEIHASVFLSAPFFVSCSVYHASSNS